MVNSVIYCSSYNVPESTLDLPKSTSVPNTSHLVTAIIVVNLDILQRFLAGELCLKKDDKSLSCEEIDVSSLVAAVAKVTVSVEIKDCHVPVDFIFTVQVSIQVC